MLMQTFPQLLMQSIALNTPTTKTLPFSVQVTRSHPDLNKAARFRAAAYGRHLPTFAAKLNQPEEADMADDSMVLIAKAKLDQAIVGTLRIQTNFLKPLPLETTVTLPQKFQNQRLAEAVRFAVPGGTEGILPRDLMFKSFYLACRIMSVDWMVICARNPLHKLYMGLHFEDVFSSGEYIPMPHIGEIPHRVLALRVDEVENLWRSPRHRLYELFFEEQHEDIDLEINNRFISNERQAGKAVV